MPPTAPPTAPRADALYPDLQRYIDFFFTELQSQTQHGPLARLKILGGVYVQAAEGATLSEGGIQVRPHHVLRVARTPIRRTGPHAFNTAGVQLIAGQFAEESLFYLHELGDAVVDDQATLARILQYVEDGPAWAAAIAGAPDRTVFNRRPAEINEVPANAPNTDINALRALLLRHFTYDDQGYFAKWAGEGRQYPDNVHADYRIRALREDTLTAGAVYCLGVVPARLTNPEADERAMREFLVQIERGEAEGEGTDGAAAAGESLSLVPVYSVERAPLAANQQPFHQFCFFHAFEGAGVLIPDSAGATLVASLSSFLADVRTPTDAQSYIQSTPDPDYFFEGTDQNLKIRLQGIVREGAALQNLPAGVEVYDIVSGDLRPEEGEAAPTGVRYFLSPLNKVVELAAHPEVAELHEVKAVRPMMTQARDDLNVPELRTAQQAAGQQGDGNDSVIGVIDTGVDGTHPAFAGRIRAVWDQSLPRQNPPTIPGGNFGRVLTGADIAAHSTDLVGHGTHVCGIATGAAAPPAYTEDGVAPRANLLVVRLRDFGDDNIVAGARWIFQQAQAIHPAPASPRCVINMSLGGHDNDHDGSDPLARALRGLIRTGTGEWRPGRLLVAAAGNERGTGLHVHRNNLPIATRTPAEVAAPATFRRENHPEATAVFEIFVRPGTVGTFFFNFFSVPTDPAVTRSNTAIRVELASGAGGWPGWVRQQPNNNFQFNRIANTRVGLSNGRAAGLGVRQSRPVLRLSSRRAGEHIDAGVWRVILFNDGPGEVEVHGYSPQSDFRFGGHQVFFRDATERCMIGSPAAAEGVISVGSTCNRASWSRFDGTIVRNERQVLDNTGTATGVAPEVAGTLSGFSNSGPVRRVDRPLDSVAPGGAIFSARSAQTLGVPANAIINDRTRVLSGTSMACPVVTGLAACLLEQFPDMTYPDFQARLRAASTMPAGGSADDFGPGIINAPGLL